MKSKQRVHWIPAGYGNFKVMPAFQQSFSSRALLWSWMGSVVDKPERFEMVELMRNADAKITDKGLLLVFDVMGGQGSKSPTDYSPILYDTKFVPLPAGTSPEHFRVWEALEAGKQTRASSESLAGLSAGLASGMTQESADVVSQSELSPYHKELLEELTAFATGAGEDCMDGSYVFA
ncbi:hypothetical protein WJX77_007549 [Trebouxia sp. C0004]